MGFVIIRDISIGKTWGDVDRRRPSFSCTMATSHTGPRSRPNPSRRCPRARVAPQQADGSAASTKARPIPRTVFSTALTRHPPRRARRRLPCQAALTRPLHLCSTPRGAWRKTHPEHGTSGHCDKRPAAAERINTTTAATSSKTFFC
jgi:hypothetical protein